MKARARIIIVCVLCLLVGFGFGFSYGFKLGVEETVHYGLMLASNFMEFEINEDMVIQALEYYKFKVQHGGAQTINALNISNSWN